MLFDGLDLENLGTYRTHKEPMQIVSNRYGSRKVFFEAPPSEKVFSEMETFIQWFNSKDQSQSILETVHKLSFGRFWGSFDLFSTLFRGGISNFVYDPPKKSRK